MDENHATFARHQVCVGQIVEVFNREVLLKSCVREKLNANFLPIIKCLVILVLEHTSTSKFPITAQKVFFNFVLSL